MKMKGMATVPPRKLCLNHLERARVGRRTLNRGARVVEVPSTGRSILVRALTGNRLLRVRILRLTRLYDRI